MVNGHTSDIDMSERLRLERDGLSELRVNEMWILRDYAEYKITTNFSLLVQNHD